MLGIGTPFPAGSSTTASIGYIFADLADPHMGSLQCLTLHHLFQMLSGKLPTRKFGHYQNLEQSKLSFERLRGQSRHEQFPFEVLYLSHCKRHCM